MFLPSQRQELPAHFTALASPTRLRILEVLAESEGESVNDLALRLRMSQPRISWHLRIMRLGGVVQTRRDGRLVYCSLDRETLRRRQAELAEMLGLAREETGTQTITREVG
ncbi:MAG: ArsR/SmtB family transcription factor [Candidatus Dormibacteraceae bacterium]